MAILFQIMQKLFDFIRVLEKYYYITPFAGNFCALFRN